MSARQETPKEKRFDWPLCQEAEDVVRSHLAAFTARNSFAARLEERMRAETGTLLIDWVDHLTVPLHEEPVLRAAGFVADPLGETADHSVVLWHPEAMLPRMRLSRGSKAQVLALRADNVADFLFAHSLSEPILGAPLTRFRQALCSEENGCRLVVVERRGYRGYVPAAARHGQIEALLRAHELWKDRRRNFDDDNSGWEHTLILLDRIVGMVGQDLACAVVFAEERAFWESRNRAARIQKARQDSLGLGWANHDHHTFRSSRQHFRDLMAALDKLGFERRERYYTGAQAGWGAQISEQPVEGIVTFCDVDLLPGETDVDFSRQPLPPAPRLGTIGLWVGLHGESFVQAGMHHLECRFDHEALRGQLADLGVNTMKPFSDLSFLWQAFTEGERWIVLPQRARRLLDAGLIDASQHQQFLNQGAIGSHLENLQRKGGFKGFNQKSVSAIIAVTDPRRATV